jgi:predicted ATPase
MQMEERPIITRVVLENYKSIAFCDVRLGPLSILVGPNGTGKSNFLDALRFLSKIMYAPLATAIQERGGFSKLSYRGSPAAGNLGLRIEFKTADAKGYYSLRPTEDDNVGYSFAREGSGIQRQLRQPPGFDTADTPNGTKSYLRLLQEPNFHLVLELIRRFRFYHFNPGNLRRPAPDGTEDLLSSDGANLPNVLHHIFERRRPVYERINQYLQVVNPSIGSVVAREVLGYRTLFFKPREAMRDFDSSQMSDGTLTSLAILVALFQRRAGAAVDLVGLEEPETSLHPGAAGALFDAMNEASSSVQVIATTHSADLLDNKQIDTESILAVELENGASRIGHVDQTGREALREKLYTAGELMRMNYLRPEASPIPAESKIESILFGAMVPT